MSGQDYTYSNYIISSSQLGTWISVTSLRPNRAAIIAINQGVSNDMVTSCNIEFWGDIDTPGTSDKGIILTVGDNISAPMTNSQVIYWKSTTTNASLEFVEYELRVEL